MRPETWIPIGIAIGTTFGIAVDTKSLPVGMAIGAGISVVLYAYARERG
ncbi:hypothetical protein [Chelativorans xinjiangense]|nr:hypothetical protein [Chelativorans xinjiangense]